MKSTKIALAVLAIAVACPALSALPGDLTLKKHIIIDYVPDRPAPKSVHRFPFFWAWFVPYLP